MNVNRIKRTILQILSSAAMALAFGLPTCYAADTAEREGSGAWKFGSEVDVLPYATKGYYGSAIAGHDGWRFRAVAARSATPLW